MESKIKRTTSRSEYNKLKLIESGYWSKRERNRYKREDYYMKSYNVYTTYGYDLINKEYVNRREAHWYITQDNYGIEWEWRKEFSHTVKKQKIPNWKLVSKAEKQWQKKKLKFEESTRLRNYYHYDLFIRF